MSIDPENEKIDVRILVRWLGVEGARAGLEKSKQHTTEVLWKIGDQLGLKLPKSGARQQMIAEIVRHANKRIERPVDDLIRMSKEELVEYLEVRDPGREELLDLLREIDATPSKDGRRALIEFAARELSETGRFRRISSTGSDDSAAGGDRSKHQADSTESSGRNSR